jgi:hypothetical protein
LIMAILLSTTSEEDTAVAKASAEGGAIMTNWASGNMSVRHKLAASAVITLLNLSVDARTVQQVGDEEICRGGLRVLFIFCQIPAKGRKGERAKGRRKGFIGRLLLHQPSGTCLLLTVSV